MKRLSALIALGLLTSCFHKGDSLESRVSTVRGFCDEWATRACNATVVKLCSAATPDDCIEAQQAFCETLIPEDKFSSKNAVACLDAVGDAYSMGSLTADQRDTVLKLGNECSKIVSGPGTAGKSCTEDSDCDRDEDLACIKKTSVTGKCQVPSSPAISGGHSCEAEEAVCEDGYYCDGENCLAGHSQGDDCSATVPCDTDSHCVDADGKVIGVGAAPDGGVATGTCAARKAVGSDCDTDDDCASQICTPTAGSTSGVCSAQISLSPSEQACKNLR
ncbi:MAG TPA: hypothetical protein VHU80_05840 [Polyangiaceae bacterium]|jgi:hypothetical protein|nr:hypothetical protein [Polyangiaceae bacterium]